MANRKGIGSHQSAKMIKDEWLTPKSIIDELGPFDLDPCSPIVRPWNTANLHYTINDNGLLMPWEGFVWLNPPYGQQTTTWLERMAVHNQGIALIFARTETEMFTRFIWPCASAILFIEGRLYFHYVNGEKAKGNAGAPSVLVAYGSEALERLGNCNIKGKFFDLR
jgi:hypothetical protein